MLEFKIIQELKPNTEILEIINHLISVSKESENLLNTLMENYKKPMKNYLKKVKK